MRYTRRQARSHDTSYAGAPAGGVPEESYNNRTEDGYVNNHIAGVHAPYNHGHTTDASHQDNHVTALHGTNNHDQIVYNHSLEGCDLYNHTVDIATPLLPPPYEVYCMVSINSDLRTSDSVNVSDETSNNLYNTSSLPPPAYEETTHHELIPPSQGLDYLPNMDISLPPPYTLTNTGPPQLLAGRDDQLF